MFYNFFIKDSSFDGILRTLSTKPPKRHHMRRYFLAFAILLTATASMAQQKRALLIAIDKYTPPPGTRIEGSSRSLFRDLDGCINDARSMYSIIMNRFEFPASNIDTLYNEKASRDGIEKTLNKFLASCNTGDIAFLYYAGHGSQVPNSLAREEADKKDESMVPSDTWKPGVKDLRDKELAVIYNKFIDKGVKLTVIMDCCHSGSLSRGPGDPGQFRFIADANYDAKDPSQPVPPEERQGGNFLIMSAAQDNEFAQEQRDENNIAHGAFTLAFIKALNQQSIDASALNLFTSIRAILKSNGRKQEPVLGGSPERQQQTLFGLSKGTVPDKYRVAISGIERDRITLQGGFALGLNKEHELVKFKGNDTLVKVRIDTILSVNKSVAVVVKGDAKDLQAGEYLDVTNWVSSGAPPLKIHIPSFLSTNDQLAKWVKLSQELKQSTKVKWVNDLEKNAPYASVFMKNNKFYVNADDGKGAREIKDLSLNGILALCPQDSTIYFELPATKELADVIKQRFLMNRNLAFTDNADDAQYVLYGTITQDGKPSYGLRRLQVSANDNEGVMPLMTANFAVNSNDRAGYNSVADSLYEYAMRLFKVRGWLQMVGPSREKANFPFHLEIVNTSTGKVVGPEGSRIGDEVKLLIKADSSVYAPSFNPASVPQKYVYVFAIDKLGKMSLLFPDMVGGNLHNRFPQLDANLDFPKEKTLATLDVGEPAGTDNLFLLATDEQITTYAILFEQDGVRGVQMRDKGESNPLGDILNLGNEKTGTRSYKSKTPSNWALYRLQVKTRR